MIRPSILLGSMCTLKMSISSQLKNLNSNMNSRNLKRGKRKGKENVKEKTNRALDRLSLFPAHLHSLARTS